ncbi:hypothetical protein BBta_7669 [Bradyrhizobium sp. BTAi1]|nr:hypothetical protein BBta_7669 [Bradyrhizobium sp. BTAi1]
MFRFCCSCSRLPHCIRRTEFVEQDHRAPVGNRWTATTRPMISDAAPAASTRRLVRCVEQFHPRSEETDMAKGQQKGNREAKKPKKEKPKSIAAAPSQKAGGWQPDFSSDKKKR